MYCFIDETEAVIEEVLDAIAKYTIGDEELLDSDHWNDTDSNKTGTESTEFDEDADIDGLAMLRIVSIQPEAPDPNLSMPDLLMDNIISSSSDDENDEEDLRAAQASLYGRSYTIDAIEPLTTICLDPIEEEIIEKTMSLGSNLNNRKPGDSSDCKISSDATGSDLP